MNLTVSHRELRPGQTAINRFMNKFQRVKMHMIT